MEKVLLKNPGRLIIFLLALLKIVIIVNGADSYDIDSPPCIKRDKRGHVVSNEVETMSIPSILTKGSDMFGDSGVVDPIFPCWFNYTRATIGQKFAQKNLAQIMNSHLLSLTMLIANEQVRRVMYATRRSDNPAKAFKRYVATGLHVNLWYRQPLNSKEWLQSVSTIRKIHTGVGAYLKALNQDFSKPVVTPENNPTGFTPDAEMWDAFDQDLENSVYNQTARAKRSGLHLGRSPRHLYNQFLMTMTQWSFVAMPVIMPERVGFPRWTEEDLKGFTHLWAVISYVLGMEENMIICRKIETPEEWQECQRTMWDIYEAYLVPSLFDMGFEGRLMVESILRTPKFLIAAAPVDFPLIQLLEDILQVPPTNMLKRADWQTRVGRFGFRYIGSPFFHWPIVQRIVNFVLHGEMQLASKKTFDGNTGTNATNVAESLYWLEK